MKREGSPRQHERLLHAGNKRRLRDRWSDIATAVNYNPHAIGLVSGIFLTAGYWLAFKNLNMAPTTPSFLRGRIKDSVGTTGIAAFTSTVSSDGAFGLTRVVKDVANAVGKPELGKEIANNRPLVSATTAFLSTSLGEIYEVTIDGQTDPDFGQTMVGYGVGALLWIGIDRAAKLLYNSGKTKSIYKALGIRDRRVIPQEEI